MKEFRIGFAPNAKDVLKAALIKRGLSEPRLLDPVCCQARRRPRPYDRSATGSPSPSSRQRPHHRLRRPRARYRNRAEISELAETKLFDKGSTVFNFARARGPAFDKGELVVVEGYMDVIALHQAGFAHAVATLGTAFTERQMEQLWQLAPEPIICFDGDRAGEAAAARAIDRMLPVCAKAIPSASPSCRKAPTPTISCATRAPAPSPLPRRRAAADRRAVAARDAARHNLDTPERRAALEERLEQLLGTIANTRVKDHYRREVKNRLFDLWRDRQGGEAFRRSRRRDPSGKTGPSRFLRPMASPSPSYLALVNHPWLLDHFAEEVATLEIRDKSSPSSTPGRDQSIIYDGHACTRERLAERWSAAAPGQALRRALAGQRLQARRLPSSQKPRGRGRRAIRRPHLSLVRAAEPQPRGAGRRRPRPKMTEAEFEHLAVLQQQVASVGSACRRRRGRPDSAKRFQETIARLKGENIGGQRGRRPGSAPGPSLDPTEPAPILHCERDVNATRLLIWARNCAFKGLCGLDTSSLVSPIPCQELDRPEAPPGVSLEQGALTASTRRWWFGPGAGRRCVRSMGFLLAGHRAHCPAKTSAPGNVSVPILLPGKGKLDWGE